MLELLGGPDLPRYYTSARPHCYEILTRAALLCDRPVEAADWARRAAESPAAMEYPAMRAIANCAQAAVRLAEGRYDAAAVGA